MQELEPTWGRVMSVWWLLAWRGAVGFVLFVFAIGLVCGVIIGIIAALANLPPGLTHMVGYVVGIVSVSVGAILSPIFVVRMALKKRYGDFHIALVPATMQYRHGAYGAQETAQRLEHHPGYRL